MKKNYHSQTLQPVFMYLNCQNLHTFAIRFLLVWVPVITLLNGCQSLPYTLSTKTPHEQIAIHEFEISANQDIVGLIATIESNENDTLPDIARHFGLGYNDITIANTQLEPWLLQNGDTVLLPVRYIIPDVKRKGIVLNLASMRLFQFPKNERNRVKTYPIGIGREGWETPTGSTRITAKKKNPSWHVPVSIRQEHAQKGDPLPRVVPPGPENPLGDYAMRLAIPSYLIHGTSKPYGVGMQISHGCVRLYPENIETLFQQTAINTRVRIIDSPYLLGWDKGLLYLEAHKPLQKNHKIHKKKLFRKLKQISRKQAIDVDWQKVNNILEQAHGVPVPVIKYSADFAEIRRDAIPLTRPEQFYKQPVVPEIYSADWSITVASFTDRDTAKKLVALLNHQGPPIPARHIRTDDAYQVIAGPYKNKREVQSVIVKIKREFQFNGIANPPHSKTYDQQQQIKWKTLVDFF